MKRIITLCIALVALAVMLASCVQPAEQAAEKPAAVKAQPAEPVSTETAPADAQAAMENIKAGYNEMDADKLTADFGAIMFTQGFTKEAYAEVVDNLHQKLGLWESEEFVSEDSGAYTWRGKFEKGSAQVVIVLTTEGKVTGLWFK
jgi:hypothetical protein